MINPKQKVSRRSVLKVGAAGILGVLGSSLFNSTSMFTKTASAADKHSMHQAVKEQGHSAMVHGYDPGKEMTRGLERAVKALTQFDYGTVSTRSDGRTVREFTMIAEDREVEIAKGIKFPGWTYNGTIPGPTLRCTEGDILRITFLNGSSHPHSIHFHGNHPTNMDGLEPVQPGGAFYMSLKRSQQAFTFITATFNPLRVTSIRACTATSLLIPAYRARRLRS